MKLRDHFRCLFSNHAFQGHGFNLEKREIQFLFRSDKFGMNCVKIDFDDFLEKFYPAVGGLVMGKGPDGGPALFHKLVLPKGYVEMAPDCFIHARQIEAARQEYTSAGIRAYADRKPSLCEAQPA